MSSKNNNQENQAPKVVLPKGMPRIYVSQSITDDCKYQEIKVTMTYRYPLSYFEKMYENRVVKKLSEAQSKAKVKQETSSDETLSE